MLKKNILALIIATGLSCVIHADNTPLADQQIQVIEDHSGEVNDFLAIDIDNLDLDFDLVTSEPDQSTKNKIRILKTYFMIQAEQAKEHIVDHKKTYLIAGSLITLGAIMYGSTYFFNTTK